MSTILVREAIRDSQFAKTVELKAPLHRPVGSGGPGESFVRGAAIVHSSEKTRRQFWVELEMAYDLSMFLQSPDNPDLVFVETAVSHASLLGPDFKRDI